MNLSIKAVQVADAKTYYEMKYQVFIAPKECTATRTAVCIPTVLSDFIY
jgi:hypothetical protein